MSQLLTDLAQDQADSAAAVAPNVVSEGCAPLLSINQEALKARIEKNKEEFLETQWDYAYFAIQDKLGKEKVR